VALGYWNDPETTAERFKPAPGQPKELPIPEIAVWSGDRVRRDDEGYLYFVSRKDEMIKTSGYRVSPTEVEEILYASGAVSEAVALGVPHPMLGQAILVIAQPLSSGCDTESLMAHCRQELPNFMVPHKILLVDSLPRNANGKFDRKRLSLEHENLFLDAARQ
jgi:acyl-coenzyme A synthetase/AMP-(fatty) acid ligase